MDSQQQQNLRDHKEEKQRNQESDDQNCSSTPPSSPSHEFSFTVSFQQAKQIPPSSSSSFAIDLSPADDIFFHGQLLPLHLLSHLPISSPRSSTNSLDCFTLPKKDHFFEDHKVQNSKNQDATYTSKGKPKAKSFSLFGIPKWRKGYDVKDQEENKERSQQNSKKMKFDVMTQVVKRYIRMVRPFLSFRSRKNMQFHRQSYSFSGNFVRVKHNKEIIRGSKGQYSSAPASMRTSPTNSGLLVATPTGAAYNNCTYSSSSDSTVEELQAAIQAAIAHCKKSISMEDKIKLPS